MQMPSRRPNPFLPAVVLLWATASAHPAGNSSDTALADAWPSFRGTPSLRGVTSATVPDQPRLLWSFPTGGPVKSTAAIVDGIAVVGSEDGQVYALRMADGGKTWSFQTDGPVLSSPLVRDGRVYVGSAGTNFYALEFATGKEVWRHGIDGEIKSSASPFPAPDGRGTWLVFGGYDNRLHCLDAATGRANWAYETGNYVHGVPAVGDGVTAFGGCDAIVHVVNLADGTLAREIDGGAYIIGSAAIVDGFAYVGQYGNEFLAIDLSKGEVAWRYRDRNFPYGASPAVTDQLVIFGGRDRRIHAVDRATGQARWTFGTRGRVESSPVVAGNRVLVGSDDGRIYLLDLEDGRERWSYEVGQAVQSSPAVIQDRFVMGADDGTVYAFGR